MSDEKITIRHAGVQDIDRLLEIDQSAMGLFAAMEFDGFLSANPAGGTREEFQTAIEAGTLRVALVDGEIAGYMECSPCDGGLYIDEVSVHQDFGRKGVGRALMASAEEYAREEGLPFVCLTTFDHLPWNRPFYEKLGFVVVPFDTIGTRFTALFEHQATYVDRAKRVAMRLDL